MVEGRAFFAKSAFVLPFLKPCLAFFIYFLDESVFEIY